MVLEYLKKFLSSKPSIIHKSDVEKIYALSVKGLREDVKPALEELSKVKIEGLDKNLFTVLNRGLVGKTPNDIIKSYIILVDKLLKQEVAVKKLISSLPENITTNNTTVKKAGILSLVENINNFTLLSGDVGLILTMGTSKDFPAKVFEDMKKNLLNINSLILVLQDIESTIKGLEKANDEININEDNVALESILKAKGEINFPVMGFTASIPKMIYNLRTWNVDRELEKYELLKIKRQYLLKRLLEIDAELNKSPEDVTLKKAKDVYIKEINKISFTIERIEQN